MTRPLRLQDLAGDWALVTGASSGIGREFALQLAAAGMHLALVARRTERLTALADELTSRHAVRVLPMPADLGELGQGSQLAQRVRAEGARIRLLVNNAALGRWAPFENSPSGYYEQMLLVNAVAPVSLCRELLPDLVSHETSGIINVGSSAAFQPVPYMAVYAASKAFLYSFSLALHQEWGERGVRVQTLLPAPTPTELEGSQVVNEAASPAQSVRNSLARLHRPVVGVGPSTLMQRVFALLPAPMVLPQVARMFRPPKAG